MALRFSGSTIKGIREASAKLAAIGVSLSSSEAGAVFLRGAKVIRSQVEAYAPRGVFSKRPGSLKKSIMAKLSPNRKGKPVLAIVKVNFKTSAGITAPHAHFIERGTKPHNIPKDISKSRPLKLFGGKVTRRTVRHPGSKSYPFFRLAVASKRAEARRVILAGLTDLINRTASR